MVPKSKHIQSNTNLQLVGGFNPCEKYESQWEGLSHILWKMFETTNQPGLTLGSIHLDTLLSLWLSASDAAADSSRAVISKDYVGLWNAKYLFHRIVMISAMEYYDLWNTMTNGIP